MRYLYAYGAIAIPATFITIVACYVSATSGPNIDLSLLAWAKIVSSLVLVLYIHLFNQHVAFFFMNLGMSRTRLYLSIFIIDIALFIVMITTACSEGMVVVRRRY